MLGREHGRLCLYTDSFARHAALVKLLDTKSIYTDYKGMFITPTNIQSAFSRFGLNNMNLGLLSPVHLVQPPEARVESAMKLSPSVLPFSASNCVLRAEISA
jgi:hypothetical protein